MADGSEIDNALLAKLASDPALLALCPDNVHWDEAPPGSTRFVTVRMVTSLDVDVFEGRAWEEVLYGVEARMLAVLGGNSAANAQAAAARIDALLQDSPLVAAGYEWMATYREGRIRIKEPDAIDVNVRWFRRGGFYRVQMVPVATTARAASMGATEGTSP